MQCIAIESLKIDISTLSDSLIIFLFFFKGQSTYFPLNTIKNPMLNVVYDMNEREGDTKLKLTIRRKNVD